MNQEIEVQVEGVYYQGEEMVENMTEQKYLAQRSAFEVVEDYITVLEETLDHLGILNNRVYYHDTEAEQAREALAQLS